MSIEQKPSKASKANIKKSSLLLMNRSSNTIESPLLESTKSNFERKAKSLRLIGSTSEQPLDSRKTI